MKTLLQKSSLAILSLLPGIALLAVPPADHLPPWFERPGVSATRQTTVQNLWVEDFDLPDGTTADAGSSAWTSAVTYSKAVFSVSNGEFKVNNISVNGLGTWTSGPISIAGKTNIQLSAAVRSAGGLENDGTPHADYLRFYYKVDSGPEILFSDMNGIINNNCTTDSTVYSTGAISGTSLQIIVRAKATATDEYYYFDNITATGESDCTAAAPEGVTANGSNQITCNTPQVNLVGFSSTPGVTYSWTGPNGFSASGAIVPVTAGGIYTLKVTNPSNGCFKLLPAIVSQNTAPPANVTAANAGPLTCTITSVDLVGMSTDTNVDYEWSGPDGYQSFSASDIATEPGEYVLTATNNANGCAVTKTTTVILNCSGQRK
ncbi:MAG TPA: hypothetical protein VLD19_08280 [Chitinophagaceae bacterium]|nr:hypothetical protein [Chitinophagaceae bacterium]